MTTSHKTKWREGLISGKASIEVALNELRLRVKLTKDAFEGVETDYSNGYISGLEQAIQTMEEYIDRRHIEMKDINLFDVLKRMNIEKPDSLHAYYSNNVENVNAGKQGWGNVKIAITTGDAQEIMNGIVAGNITKSIMLFVVDRRVMDETKKETEQLK